MLVIVPIAGICNVYLKFAAHHKPEEFKSTEPVPTYYSLSTFWATPTTCLPSPGSVFDCRRSRDLLFTTINHNEECYGVLME